MRTLRAALDRAALVLLAGLVLAGCGAGARDRAAAPSPAPPPVAGAQPAAADTLEPAPGGTIPATPVPTPPATGRPKPGYDRRVDDLRSVNTAGLRDRKIALDPGHGGRFPGSIGAGGLTEAEVNLGVALHLWGLLTDAGAEVFLTRTADRDFPAAGDSSLRVDLATRTERANRWGPEAFVSIHHNADPGRRNNVNEIQTYYRFDDPVASRELAEAIHRRLKRNLGIEADRILPGNFYVIRNSDAPAVLGESSYLTNPDVEARLALAAKQRLEAEAYFLGLADYFARGVPRVLAARVEAPPGATPDDARERPWLVLEADRPLDRAQLVFDGEPVDSTEIALVPGPGGRGLARFRPATPLTDGRHTAQWVVRAKDGGWSKTKRDTLDVELPVARVTFEAEPPRELAPGQVVALTLRALDRNGSAIADTLRATFASRVGAVLVDSLARRAWGPGEARAYARITGGGVAALTARIAPGGAVPPSLASRELTLQLAAAGAPSEWTSGFVRAVDGTPVGGAEVSWAELGATTRTVTSPEGFFAIPTPDSTSLPASGTASRLSCRKKGYVTAGDPSAYRLAVIAGGALLGKRIAIDPAGGGVDTTGLEFAIPPISPPAPSRAGRPEVLAGGAADTTRALVLDDSLAVDSTLGAALAAGDSLARRRAQAVEANANLLVAVALRKSLEAAGAIVSLTREWPESLTAVDRLRRTEAFRPDRVLVLSHRAAPGTASAGHYFSSTGGRALAGRIAARLRGRGVVARAPVGESASYVVAQTAAVASSVNLPVAEPLGGVWPLDEAQLRDEAYAIYLALLEDFGADPRTWQDVVATVARGDSAQAVPAAGVEVTLDARWTLFTDATGRVRFEGLPASARMGLEAGTPGREETTRTWVMTPVAGVVQLTIVP